jgi:hypothetical protein
MAEDRTQIRIHVIILQGMEGYSVRRRFRDRPGQIGRDTRGTLL